MEESAVVPSDKQPEQQVPEKEFQDFGFLERAVCSRSFFGCVLLCIVCLHSELTLCDLHLAVLLPATAPA